MICPGSVLCPAREDTLAQKCVIPKTTRATWATRDTFTNCGLFRKMRGVCAAFCTGLNSLTRATPGHSEFDEERPFETLYSVGLLLACDQGRRRSA